MPESERKLIFYDDPLGGQQLEQPESNFDRGDALEMSVLATPKINISNLDADELRISPKGPGKSKSQMKSKVNERLLSMTKAVASKNSHRQHKPSVTSLGQTASSHMHEGGIQLHEGGLMDLYVDDHEEEKLDER